MFQDRRDAGERLGAALAALTRGGGVIVVAGLARGGVIVAAGVARALAVPTCALVVRKIALPADTEFALGAVAAGGEPVWNSSVLGGPPAPGGHLAARARAAREEAATLQARFGAGWTATVAGAHLILVDDGLATGLTALAAVARGRELGATTVTLAVAVASPEGAALLRAAADRLVCLAEPPDFRAVGLYYARFEPVTDAQVQATLA